MPYIDSNTVQIGKITDNVGTISFRLTAEHSGNTVGVIFMRLYCDMFHIFFDEDLVLHTTLSITYNNYMNDIKNIKSELLMYLSKYFENEKTGNQN